MRDNLLWQFQFFFKLCNNVEKYLFTTTLTDPRINYNKNIITWLFLTRWGEKYIVLVQFCTIFDTKFVCLQTVKIHYLEWWPCGQGCELFLQSHATSRLPIFQAIGPPHPSLPLIHPISHYPYPPLVHPLIPHTHMHMWPIFLKQDKDDIGTLELFLVQYSIVVFAYTYTNL